MQEHSICFIYQQGIRMVLGEILRQQNFMRKKMLINVYTPQN